MPLAPRGARGEDTEFIDFYRSEYPRAVGLAYTLVGSSQAAEDIVQEVFSSLHQRFLDTRNPGGYLRRGIVNRSRNIYRQRRNEGRRVLAFGVEPVPATTSSELFDVMMKLPYRPRAVLVLRYWADWSEAEIAEALGCRQGAVKSMAHRALARLRKEIEP